VVCSADDTTAPLGLALGDYHRCASGRRSL